MHGEKQRCRTGRNRVVLLHQGKHFSWGTFISGSYCITYRALLQNPYMWQKESDKVVGYDIRCYTTGCQETDEAQWNLKPSTCAKYIRNQCVFSNFRTATSNAKTCRMQNAETCFPSAATYLLLGQSCHDRIFIRLLMGSAYFCNL